MCAYVCLSVSVSICTCVWIPLGLFEDLGSLGTGVIGSYELLEVDANSGHHDE